jgi:signal transduction histidine kinase
MSIEPEQPWIRRLLDVGRTLMTELDPQTVLDRVLETAREITGARYAALGILNEERTELDRFLTVGVDHETHRAIGDLPRGRGVLGVLIEEPSPLRLRDVGAHPLSYGFPAGHPVMRSFLGVPLLIRGETWGNLYLTEKEGGGGFTETDGEAATILAEWAAIAIENARLYQTSERRRRELEKAFRGLEATRDVVIAIGGEISLEHVLEMIVKRGRALADVRSLVIMLREGPELVLAAGAGHVQGAGGTRMPIADSTSGHVLRRGEPERIDDVTARLRLAPQEFGVPDPHTALLVPMVHRGEALGVLAAFDRSDEASFSEDDEQLLQTFATSAATAVALAQGVRSDRLRSSLAAADAERSRWARELHDETLQGLGGLRVLLSSALRRKDPEHTERSLHEAVGQLEREIENLRSVITELRPAALDELGLQPAIEALLVRHREHSGFAIDSRLELAHLQPGAARLDAELETTVYRLLQEALTNIAKHAQARHVRVAIEQTSEELQIEVQDDGTGFAVDAQTTGFGLAGMRERVSLAGGTLRIASDEQGTLVQAQLPCAEAFAGSRVAQLQT